jgi:nucleotide-binding universal stress UspA family protein
METTPLTHPRYIVGVDGSPSSIAALGYARDLALKLDAHVRAVAVWHYPMSYTPMPTTYSPKDDAIQMLSEVTSTVFGSDPPEWYEQVVDEGTPTHVLLKESAAADLLIVGSRGHGGFAGLLLGSVSAQVAEHADCPVLVMH